MKINYIYQSKKQLHLLGKRFNWSPEVTSKYLSSNISNHSQSANSRDGLTQARGLICKIVSLLQAFTGSIVERAVQPNGNIESVDAVTHQEIPRKVSQFRSRQKDASEVTEQSKGQTMQPEHSNIEVESVPKKVSKFKSQRQQIQR